MNIEAREAVAQRSPPRPDDWWQDPGCTHINRRVHLKAAGGCGLDEVVLVRCTACNLVFEDPRPSARAIEEFYGQTELWTRSSDAEGRPRSYVRELEAKKPLFIDLARRIERRCPAGDLLDVGSGPGLLELALDRRRWRVHGIDRSPFIAEFGRRELGTNVTTGLFESASIAPSSFDVIVMKYVLDHLETPLVALRKARQAIKPDGLLVVADLINIDSLCARVFREGHRLIHPMHFTYFSARTAAAMLMQAGFRVIDIEYPYFRTPYFTSGNVTTLATRMLRRGWNVLLGEPRAIVYSVPFYGNMMDLWAVPA